MSFFLRLVMIACVLCYVISPQFIRAEVKEATVTIDATNREDFIFFSFDVGKVVVVEDQKTSLKWDLGLKRTEAIVNGGSSGNGKGGAVILEKVNFSEITHAPAGEYISDTEKIATIARGDGWYSYTGHPLHQILVRDKVFVLRTAKGHFAKFIFVGYYKDNKAKKDAGHIRITYAYQDDGGRSFVIAKQTMVRPKRKLTVTWAEIKTDKQF